MNEKAFRALVADMRRAQINQRITRPARYWIIKAKQLERQVDEELSIHKEGDV